MIDYVRIPEERLKILKNDKKSIEKLEKFTECKIDINEEVTIEMENPVDVLRIKQVFQAFGRGFDFEIALNLLDEEYYLEVIDVKEFSRKSRARQIELKGRVIGTEGKTKKSIEQHTETNIAVYGKTISVIGKWDKINLAREAIEMLLSGSLHNTVYRFLEKSRR
jgi:ribosomal RNA assembly protein